MVYVYVYVYEVKCVTKSFFDVLWLFQIVRSGVATK